MTAADYLILALAGLITGSACEQLATGYVAPAPALGRARTGRAVWTDRLPVIGALTLRPGPGGRDKTEGRSRRIMAETVGAISAPALAGLLLPDLLTAVFAVVLAGLLVVLSVVDLHRMILPDRLNAAVLATGLVFLLLHPAAPWLLHAAGAAAGYGLLRGLEFLYRRLRGFDGLGRGDAKLLGALGLWNGLTMLAPILLIASLTALVFTLVRAALQRAPLRATTAVPFGPWLALAGYVTWIMQVAGFA